MRHLNCQPFSFHAAQSQDGVTYKEGEEKSNIKFDSFKILLGYIFSLILNLIELYILNAAPSSQVLATDWDVAAKLGEAGAKEFPKVGEFQN